MTAWETKRWKAHELVLVFIIMALAIAGIMVAIKTALKNQPDAACTRCFPCLCPRLPNGKCFCPR